MGNSAPAFFLTWNCPGECYFPCWKTHVHSRIYAGFYNRANIILGLFQVKKMVWWDNWSPVSLCMAVLIKIGHSIKRELKGTCKLVSDWKTDTVCVECNVWKWPMLNIYGVYAMLEVSVRNGQKGYLCVSSWIQRQICILRTCTHKKMQTHTLEVIVFLLSHHPTHFPWRALRKSRPFLRK